jgi:hypothetical protein
MANQTPTPDQSDDTYEPTEDEQTLISEVTEKFDRWRQNRRPHEVQWFVNTAFLRGQQYVAWSDTEQRLAVTPAPSHRVRLAVNRIFPKVRARLAKFLKQRPQPIVVPASTDRDDTLNARATQKALDYLWRKLRLEGRYKEALIWASMCGKGFWWFSWDPTVRGRVSIDNELGQSVPQEAEVGDVVVEAGSPFEVLVANQEIARIADQFEIMRVKLRDLSDLKARFPDHAAFLKSEGNSSEIFHYEKQIATLSAKGVSGLGMLEDRVRGGVGAKSSISTYIIVKELFQRPSPKYPKGRYVMVAGSVLLKAQEELPYNLANEPNPFPCVEFIDVSSAGQFWGTTVIEQLIPLQKEYNLIRSKIAEQLRMLAFPKIFVAKQHQIADSAWTSEAGELIEYVALPGLPPPTPFIPPNIAADAWRVLDLLKEEFQDVSHIYPVSEGSVGAATSGFQTNLLQEAADSVHAPDIRNHELSIEEAAWKCRKLMKQGYTTPRLISIAGRNYAPDVFEFSSDEIDEDADIIVQAGSALPTLKGAKIKSVLELWDAGILGDQNDPENKRRTLGMLDMAGMEGAYELARRDEDQSRLENDNMRKGIPVQAPEFYEAHAIHYSFHTDQLKAADTQSWPPERRQQLLAHTLQHFKFINQAAAFQLAQEHGMPDLIPPPPAPQPPPPPPQKSPIETIQFKDLPPEGQAQLAKQAGIDISPQHVVNQQQRENPPPAPGPQGPAGPPGPVGPPIGR